MYVVNIRDIPQYKSIIRNKRDNLIIDVGAFTEKSAVRVEGQSKDEPWRNSGRSVSREESRQK